MSKIEELIHYSRKGFLMLLTVISSVFLFGFSSEIDQISKEDEAYELLLISDEELEEKYSSFHEEEKIKLEIEEQLSEYLVEEQNGKFFDVPEEVYINLSSEVKNVVDASLYVFQMYLDGDVIIDEGEYVFKSEADKISLQNEEFKLIWKKLGNTLGI